MKKRIFVVLLVTMFVLTACGGAKKGEGAKERQGEADSLEETDSRDDSTLEDKAGSGDLKPFSTDATIEETVLVDENGVRIVATGLEYGNNMVNLNLLIENNSGQDLSFVSGSLGYSCNSINGYMVEEGYMNADVTAGNKANETVSFSMDGLRLYGITEVADIEIGFSVSDSDYNHFYSGPRQVRTSIADAHDYSVDTYKETVGSGALEKKYNFTVDYFGEGKLFEQNGVKIVSEAKLTNKDGEEVLFLEVENTSPEPIYFATKDISINGLAVGGSIVSYDMINPGARGLVDISLSSLLNASIRETVGIDEIGNVSFFAVSSDDEANEICTSEEIQVEFSKDTATFDGSGEEVYNENGIRIVFKDLLNADGGWGEETHLLLLVENGGEKKISVSDVYDSLSVNGFMMDYTMYGAYADVGKSALLDIKIREDALEENGIADVSDITEASISLEIEDENYNTIAEPKVKIEFGQ